MSPLTTTIEDKVADAVLEKYRALPAKSKPVAQAVGIYQWIPLSGIVLSTKSGSKFECVALG